MAKIVSNTFSFNDINVNVIEENSGIFIGDIHANYWSSRVKENHGVGQISGSTVQHLTGIVQDNDQRDVTLLEKNTFIKQANSSEANVLKDIDIKVNGINVNFITGNSSVATGVNEQEFWRANTKDNFGTGEFIGINEAESVFNYVDDRDIVDQFNDAHSVQSSVQNQSG